jgi:hypothetical protein
MSTWWEERTARVHQATDIISAQANCSSSEALTLLRRQAAEHGSDLEEIALAVVGRRMSFGEKKFARRRLDPARIGQYVDCSNDPACTHERPGSLPW